MAEEQDFCHHLESSVRRRDVDDVCCHCVMMDANELDVDKVRVCVVFVKEEDDLGLQGDKAGELEPLRVDQPDVKPYLDYNAWTHNQRVVVEWVEEAHQCMQVPRHLCYAYCVGKCCLVPF